MPACVVGRGRAASSLLTRPTVDARFLFNGGRSPPVVSSGKHGVLPLCPLYVDAHFLFNGGRLDG